MIFTPENRLVNGPDSYPVAIAMDEAGAVKIAAALNQRDQLVVAMRAIKRAAAGRSAMTCNAIEDMAQSALIAAGEA